MLKQSLVYIHAAGDDGDFVGCGAYIEQNLIVTCRHVWRDAAEHAKAVFPHLKKNGAAAVSPLELIDLCKVSGGDDPDIVLLRATEPPQGLIELQIARDEAYETRRKRALSPGCNPRHRIPRARLGSTLMRRDDALSQPSSIYWLENGAKARRFS